VYLFILLQLFPEGPSAKHVNIILWGGRARRLPNILKILMMGESKWFLQRKN